MRFSLPLLALLSFAAMRTPAHATNLSFTQSTTASGSLNGVGFTGRSFTITGTFDTTQINSSSPQGVQWAPTTLTYTIGGLGSVTSVPGTSLFANLGDYIFVNQSQSVAGVGDYSNGLGSTDFLDASNGAYSSLSLSDPFGPIAGTNFFSNRDFTSGGLLQVDSTADVTLTTAAVPTPEPSSLILIATGIGALVSAGRRRHQQGKRSPQ